MENNLGVKLDHWLKQALVAIFHFGALTLPLVFAFNTDELFEFNKIIFVYIWSTTVGIIWLIRLVLQKRVLIVKTPFDLPIIGLIISQLLATLFSIHPYTSLFGYYSRFHGGLLSTLAYCVLFYVFVATFSENHQQKTTTFWQQPVMRWFVSLIGGSLFASFYALPEHFGYSFSCQLATGRFNVSCWVQDVQNRIFGSFGQPNWLAAYLILLIPIGSSLLIIVKKSFLWALLLSTITLWYSVLLFTKSRSGLLGLGVGLVLMFSWYFLSFLTGFRSHKLNLNTRIGSKLFLLGGLLLICTLLFGTPITPSLSQLFSNSQPVAATSVGPALESGGTESGVIRKIVWQGAIDVWKKYPFFGSGLETFAYSYYQSRPIAHNLVSEWDFLYNKAHNEWLNYLATTGAIGFSAFLIVMLSPYLVGLTWLFKFKTKAGADQTNFSNELIFSGGILGGLTALHISNFLGFSTVTVTVLQFLLMGVLAIVWNNKIGWVQNPELKSPTTVQYLFIASLVIVGLVLVGKTWQIRQADVLYAEGKARIQQNQFAEGSDKILSALILRPQETSYYSTLGGYYANIAGQLQAGQQASQAAVLASQSATLLENSTQINPAHYTLYLAKIAAYMQLAPLDNQWLEKALDVVAQAKILAPTDPRPWLLEGKIMGYLSQYDQAVASLQKALELKPNYAEARGTLATIYELQNNPQSALEQYRYIIEKISPDDTVLKEKVASLEAQLN